MMYAVVVVARKSSEAADASATIDCYRQCHRQSRLQHCTVVCMTSVPACLPARRAALALRRSVSKHCTALVPSFSAFRCARTTSASPHPPRPLDPLLTALSCPSLILAHSPDHFGSFLGNSRTCPQRRPCRITSWSTATAEPSRSASVLRAALPSAVSLAACSCWNRGSQPCTRRRGRLCRNGSRWFPPSLGQCHPGRPSPLVAPSESANSQALTSARASNRLAEKADAQTASTAAVSLALCESSASSAVGKRDERECELAK